MRAKNAVRSAVIESARLTVNLVVVGLVARFAKSVASIVIVVVRRVTGA